MPCIPIKVPGGVGIVCTRTKPRRCACGRKAPFLCDGPPRRKGSKACNRPLCERCAVPLGPDRHNCAECTAAPELPLFAPGEAR